MLGVGGTDIDALVVGVVLGLGKAAYPSSISLVISLPFISKTTTR